MLGLENRLNLDLRHVVKILSEILYRIERFSVSIDVAFKETCRNKRCGRNLWEREQIYNLARDFISSVIKLRCIHGEVSRSRLAKIFVEGSSEGYGLVDDRYNIREWCIYSIPEWLYQDLSRLLDKNELDRLLSSLHNRWWWLRINTLKASEEKVYRMLEKENVEFENDKDLWYLIKVIGSRKPIRLLEPVKKYYAIPQDKASCLVVEALNPQYGDEIVDACSAPGLKSSLIYMLTEGKARLTLVDVSRKRIFKMKHLLKKLGITDLDGIVLADSTQIKLARRFNKALIDAPCSSTGAIGKDPAIRLIISSRDKLNYYSKIQKEILRNIARYADITVYATCSIHPKEGEEVIESLLNYMKPLPLTLPTSKGYRIYKVSETVARTFPHIHSSDGFFISMLAYEA